MKLKTISCAAIIAFVLALSTHTFSQQRPPTPRPSQKASVMQTIGSVDVSVTYSRPAVKGRKVYGDWPTNVPGEATLDNGGARPKDAPLVPWGHVWRTGANEATLFVVTDDVLINGQPLAAGKYSLHSIPGQNEWTFIFNKDDGQWGSFSYDAAKDVLRVKSTPKWVDDSQELLAFTFDPVADDTATVNLRWEKLAVPFTVKVKDMLAATMSRLTAFVAAAAPDDPAPALSAANWAKNNKQIETANKWFEIAIDKSKKQVKKQANFANLQRQSNIYFAAGNKQESLKSAEKAVAAGKKEKADTAALEKRIADIKAGK